MSNDRLIEKAKEIVDKSKLWNDSFGNTDDQCVFLIAEALREEAKRSDKCAYDIEKRFYDATMYSIKFNRD